jgi:hypothetical protein
MVFIDPDGRLQQIEAVLDMEHFARIEPGKSDQESVLRLIGPPVPQWTNYFKARDELVWEWQFCDAWNQLARFDVLFDALPASSARATKGQALMGVQRCGSILRPLVVRWLAHLGDASEGHQADVRDVRRALRTARKDW